MRRDWSIEGLGFFFFVSFVSFVFVYIHFTVSIIQDCHFVNIIGGA